MYYCFSQSYSIQKCQKSSRFAGFAPRYPVFHDVLVFKRENIIVGAAKICFSCQKRVFFGESFSDDALQREIEYERLKEILKNN